MAISFDLRQFVSTLGKVASGQLAGNLAGTLQRTQQEQQQYQQAMQAAQIQNEANQAQDKTILGQDLEPSARAQALGSILSRPSPYAGLAQQPYVQSHPALQSVLPQSMVAKPMTAAQVGQPQGGESFSAPQYGGTLSLGGVDKKTAATALANLEKSYQELGKLTVTDPRAAQARQTLFDQRGQISQIRTPQDLANANGLLNSINQFTAQVGGPQTQAFQEGQLRSDIAGYEQEFEKGSTGLSDEAFAATLPGHLQTERSIAARRGTRGYGGKGLQAEAETVQEIQDALTAGDKETATRLGREVRGRLMTQTSPTQESAAVKRVMQQVGMLNPRTLTPDLVRSIYQKNGVGYLVEGLPDEAVAYGGSAAEKNFQKDLGILSDASRWAKLPKSVQGTIINEIVGTAKLTGRKISLPASIVLQADPETLRRLAQTDKRIDLQGRSVDIAAARLAFEKQKFDWAKENGAAAGGRLTANAALRGARDAWQSAWGDYHRLSKNLYLTEADFDINHPKPGNKNQQALSQKYQAAVAAGQQYRNQLLKNHVDIDFNIGVETPAEQSKLKSLTGQAGAGASPNPNSMNPAAQKPLSSLSDEELAQRFAAAAAGRLRKR